MWRFTIQAAVDNSLDPVLQVRFAEIYEKPEFKIAETQLRQKLFRVHRKQCFNRFEFGNNFSVHDQVRPKRLVESNAIVHNWHRFLTLRS